MRLNDASPERDLTLNLREFREGSEWGMRLQAAPVGFREGLRAGGEIH
jgi:hypothetical protein